VKRAAASVASTAPTSVAGRGRASRKSVAVVSASAAGPCCQRLCEAIIQSGEPSAATSVAGSATAPSPRRRSTSSSTTPVTATIAALAFLAVQRAYRSRSPGVASHPGRRASSSATCGTTNGNATSTGITG
jgi:hypothetical protein